MDILIYGLPLVAFLILAVAGMIYGSHKVLAIWMTFSGIVLCALALCVYWQKSAETPEGGFAVTIQTAFLNIRRESSAISLIYLSGKGRTVSPLPVALFINIVDLDGPQMVSSMAVEFKAARGEWLRLTEVDPRDGELYWTFDLKESRRLSFVGGDILSALRSKTFHPGETAEGWAVFTAPIGFNEAPRPLRFRFLIEDSAGSTFRTEIVGPTEASGIPLQERGISVSGNSEDLSSLPIVPIGPNMVIPVPNRKM